MNEFGNKFLSKMSNVEKEIEDRIGDRESTPELLDQVLSDMERENEIRYKKVMKEYRINMVLATILLILCSQVVRKDE